MKRGELLSDKRIEKGLSVSALAQKLGVSAAEVERWEAGELPESGHLLALSALLDISVEDILRGGEEADEAGALDSPAAGAQGGKADGANDAGKTQERETGTGELSRRFDFGEVRKERGARSAPKKAAPQESYYEKLHKKIRYSDDPSSPDYRTGGSDYNGFSDGERKFGYIVCLVFAIAIIIANAVYCARLMGYLGGLPRENFSQYMNPSCIAAEVERSDLSEPVRFVLGETQGEYRNEK